jgi:hypothetical protein
MTAPPASKFFAFGNSDVGVGRNSRLKKPCAALFGDADRRALFGSVVEYEDAVTNDSAGFGTSEVRRFLELLSANVEFEKRNPASSGSAADGHDSAARKRTLLASLGDLRAWKRWRTGQNLNPRPQIPRRTNGRRSA